MPTGFESFLNWATPIGVVIFFAAVIYKSLKEPIDWVIAGIKKLIMGGAEKLSSTENYTSIIQYE